ncbi:MAG: hypothetical protein KKF12_13920 [Proteobacteria bacterium]|nr:hypothetical protein [Desulfobacula sp.]MBU3915243.1 hypothetical protein [bacterium]MBU4131913.1 hypothetical protein [Pseudomonadota bacterium]
MTKTNPHIVDIQGLADVFQCSKDTVYKNWQGYPHFFVGTGRNGKSARFIVDHVIGFLTNRDYTNTHKRSLQRGSDRGINRSAQEGNLLKCPKLSTIQAQYPSKVVQRKIPPIEVDPHNLFGGLRTDIENKRHVEYWQKQKR